MAIGLTALLDDIAAIAKLAVASLDDIGAAAGKAGTKAIGVVVDDAAVTPAYVQGLAAERELPIIKKIAIGSIRNKLLIILPAALILSVVAPILVEIILMFGGLYLCYEGAHKIWGALTTHNQPVEVPASISEADPAAVATAEAATISGAIRTDFILSAEIMVISLKELLDEPVVNRGLALVVIALGITALIYGVVALIVKMDDFGLRLATRDSEASQRFGAFLVRAMPKLLVILSVVGTAAMLWVGGHILLAGADELGWSAPYDVVHDLGQSVHDLSAIGGVASWFVSSLVSAVLGFLIGSLIVWVMENVVHKFKKTSVVDPESQHSQH